MRGDTARGVNLAKMWRALDADAFEFVSQSLINHE
jgi:hypothetical protein